MGRTAKCRYPTGSSKLLADVMKKCQKCGKLTFSDRSFRRHRSACTGLIWNCQPVYLQHQTTNAAAELVSMAVDDDISAGTGQLNVEQLSELRDLVRQLAFSMKYDFNLQENAINFTINSLIKIMETSFRFFNPSSAHGYISAVFNGLSNTYRREQTFMVSTFY